ncbi:tRNA (adenosine(37)-N6)-threonylcarbamoyltransferase complex ATPase subunit type 1 TsaE [uncultured Lentibacter sp.]|uniref:tRNA (adenosine(37)-N6)-threonylcarbamoyltransferase complex ATPase subunit type 1 TsaE n=1 Tax=uncultured Lentibacter sp. TaxID=1659309 RepID=UPI0026324F0C|nr:tRNA (adenosine(37)-N6)-threonylcarbamoyltransferase complex ATPase subunit type 1 TsaE [uncultured Lentibacter sp.]
MAQFEHSTLLGSEAITSRFAAALGARLAAGDTVLLQGGIGAGKTHLARALILSRLALPEDIPSPTFTLVQTYHAKDETELWHADLYRLTDPSELEELGLTDAFEDAICLIEWPDRLGSLRPADALTLTLELTAQEGERTLHLSGPARWSFLKELDFT